MKKIVLLASIICLLAGCDVVTTSNRKDIDTSRFVLSRNDPADNIQSLTDTQTGCKYLVFSNSNSINGIAALLDENGKPVGCKSVK